MAIQGSGVIISNCQAAPLREAMDLSCRGISFASFGIHILPPQNMEAAINAFVARSQAVDIIITVPLSSQYGSLSYERIAETFPGKPIVFIPNLYFSGLHPDLTYLGDISGRVQGLLSDYHSKLVTLGYVAGLGAAEVRQLFRHDVFEKIGYFDEFDDSLKEAYRRDDRLTVKFAEEMEHLLRQNLCFLTVNHPTSFLFAHLCSKISAMLDAAGLAHRVDSVLSPFELTNILAQRVIFPVYPEIAAKFELSYPGSYMFKPAGGAAGSGGRFSLEEFIARELEMLSRVDVNTLKRSRHIGQFLQEAGSALDLKI